jgi:hypothetical protein
MGGRVFTIFRSRTTEEEVTPNVKYMEIADLKSALKMLAKQTRTPLKLFFLIDGLDEFDEDPEDLLVMFRDTMESGKGRIRFCLSSRPWVIFEDSFGKSANLKMSNLTHKDIETYVEGKMRANTAFQRLAEAEPETTEELVQEIVQKAEGVFLWVRIVVKSLLSGMRNLDDMSDLWRRLELLPKELEPLYEHLMIQIEPVYLEWVSKVFRIIQISRGFEHSSNEGESHHSRPQARRNPLTLIALNLALADNFDVNTARAAKPRPIEARCQTLATQLIARCAGFLEVTTHGVHDTVGPTSCVSFLHRTARDFLETRERWDYIVAPTLGTTFNPVYALIRGSSLCVVLDWHLYGEGHSYRVTTDLAIMGACALELVPQANAQGIDLKGLYKLFEELGKAMGWDEVGRQKLTRQLTSKSNYQYSFSFFELAALFGLWQYVLPRVMKSSQDERNSLLNLLLNVAEEVPLLPSSSEIISALLHLGAKPGGDMSISSCRMVGKFRQDTTLGKRKLAEFESGYSEDDLDEESDEDDVEEVTRAEFIAKRLRYATE